MAINPTKHRLSDHFLLSDFMGCDSVYRKGYRNQISSADAGKIEEGKHLCDFVLERVEAEHPGLSISYGFISPELSRRVVSYQNPDKPSYHRWDHGAAADICVHDWVGPGKAPIRLAYTLYGKIPFSRMITYSESPWICLSSRVRELYAPRKAFYENRYVGVRRPEFKKISEVGLAFGPPKLEHDWRGQGYPSYHGRGRRQYHHIRLSRYTMLSDFLYQEDAVHKGYTNAPPANRRTFRVNARRAGRTVDCIVEGIRGRVSIVKGYVGPRIARETGKQAWLWDDQFVFDVVPPASAHIEDVAQAALGGKHVDSVTVAKHGRQRRVRVTGKRLNDGP